MRDSITQRQQLRELIKDEIAERVQAHQARIKRLKASRSAFATAGAAAAAPRPLVMLAHGDSWFDYPLDGNAVSFNPTDVIAQLQAMGNPMPLIVNASHFGDATSDELSLPKQQRMIDILRDHDNWLERDAPDAILFSCGGNDIAGDQFCIFLDFALPGAGGLNPKRFDDALGAVEAGYLDLFAFRDRYAPGVPVFGHCYDFPIPNGVHPICAGPWLLPSLEYAGWGPADGAQIVRQALERFRSMLGGMAQDAANNFVLVDTQGTLATDDWANELHPFPGGFRKLADRFVSALRQKFPGRI